MDKHRFYHQWKMLTINLHYEKTFPNPYLLVESHLHDDVDAKEAFNHVLQKNINSSTTYA